MTAPEQSQPTSNAAQKVVLVFVALMIGFFVYRRLEPNSQGRPTSLARMQIDLNRGSIQEFEQVPGIGPGLAAKIVEHRQSQGEFTSVSELQRVPGIGDKTLEKLRPWLTVAHEPRNTPTPDAVLLERKPITPPPMAVKPTKIQPGEPPLDPNTADSNTLQRLPGVGPTLAERIIAYRENKPFTTVDDLRQVKGIGPKTLENIRPFIAIKPTDRVP
ncbi:MAG: ComEA family DNA-binding protein [Fimbriiglobus sp.]